MHMKLTRAFLVTFASLALCLLPDVAGGALNAYLTLEGQSQGDIEGDVTLAGREGTIEVTSFEYEVASPRDAATGLPTGRRQHEPIKVTKRVDQSSPMLFQALVTNENLPSFELRFYRPTREGREEQFYTVRLTDARVTKVRVVQPDTYDPANDRRPLTEEVSFVFQSIEVVYEPTGTTAQDDWQEQPR